MTRRGFTLIELLVVISIIGILSSVILVALRNARLKGSVGAGFLFDSHNHQLLGADQILYDDFNNNLSGLPANQSSYNAVSSAPKDPLTYSSDIPGGGGQALDINEANPDPYVGPPISKQYLLEHFSSPVSITNKSLTISMWLKARVYNTTLIEILSSDSGAKSVFGLTINKCTPDLSHADRCVLDQLVMFVNCSGAGTAVGVPQLGIPLDEWHHIAITVTRTDQTSSNYLDGKFVGTSTLFAMNPTINDIQDVAIGAAINGGARSYFNGLIDNVAIYDQALASSEIHEIYAEGRAAHPLARSDGK